MTPELTNRLVRLIKRTQPDPSKKGKLFEVTFVKKDDTLRTMRARLGMSSKVTGKGLAFNPASRGMMPVWSADSQGFRMLTPSRIVELKTPDSNGRLTTVYTQMTRAITQPEDNFIALG